MTMTGKRHDFLIDYDVGFDDDGRITGIEVMQAARCGYAPDLSHSVADRAMYHADNAYFLENVTITSRRLSASKMRTASSSSLSNSGFEWPDSFHASPER